MLLFLHASEERSSVFPESFGCLRRLFWRVVFGHLIEAGIFWWPIYRFSGLVKGFTAIISWVTVFMLIRLMPAALRLPSAALLANKLLKSQERLDIALSAAEVGVWELDLTNNAVECDARDPRDL